jgi:ketosteroid isomerase-like protein
MKNLILILLVALTFSACQQKQRYTQQSPEIDIVKANIEHYVSGNWDAMLANYAEGAMIFNNVTEAYPATREENIEQHKMALEPISSYSFDREEEAAEMVIDDKNETWVNYWGVWKGVLTATGETIELPVHLTCQFEDGKIVKQYGYWDSGKISTALMQYEAAQKAAADSMPSN